VPGVEGGAVILNGSVLLERSMARFLMLPQGRYGMETLKSGVGRSAPVLEGPQPGLDLVSVHGAVGLNGQLE